MNTHNIKILCLQLIICISPFFSQGQAVKGIITDYNGFWKTNAANVNAQKPDDNHNLLAFTYKNVQYSTGANDPLLSTNGETFTPCDFWSLPVGTMTGKVNGNTKIGLGAMNDRVKNGPGNKPPVNDIPTYLTDGIKGLNIGTCVANLPNGSMSFYVLSIAASAIGDGKPDILVTQVADPSNNSFDRYEFTDAAGNRVGNYMDIVFKDITPVGNWTGDFYEANVHPSVLTPGFTHTDRPLRLWAADLSEFGLTSSNIQGITNFKINLSGNSDVAFVAYNKMGMDVSVLPINKFRLKGKAIEGNIQLSWKREYATEDRDFEIEKSSDGRSFTKIGNIATGNVTAGSNYTFTDYKVPQGINYYRLKYADQTSAVHYSTIAEVTIAQQSVLRISKTTNKGYMVVDHPAADEHDNFFLYNISGIRCMEGMPAKESTKTTLDISALPRGVYLLQWKSQRKTQSLKFVL